MWNGDTISCFCTWICSWPRTVCWKDYSSPIELSQYNFWKSIGHKYYFIFGLSNLVCYMYLSMCPNHTILTLLFFFKITLAILFLLILMQILGSTVNFCKEVSWYFNMSSNPRICNIFPLIWVFYNFFQHSVFFKT